MGVREKILSIFGNKRSTIRKTAEVTGLPKSTVHYHQKQSEKGSKASNTSIWESEEGYRALVRLVIGSIYVFGVKGGKGAGSMHEFFKMSALDQHAGLSESTLLKIIKRIEALILEYREAQATKIASKIEEIQLILGVDETWLDQMYLVCQELSSGYIFFEESSDQRTSTAWDEFIKKNLYTTS